MNYLKENLHNSITLNYDIMKLIYEYADHLCGIRKQIENKTFDLDEIMYNRMKKEIINTLNNGLDEYYLNYWTNDQMTAINETNIDEDSLRDLIIYGQCGYKDLYLYQRLRKTKICGLEPTYGSSYFRYEMIRDLKEVKPNVNYITRSIKQLYKLWIKL